LQPPVFTPRTSPSLHLGYRPSLARSSLVVPPLLPLSESPRRVTCWSSRRRCPPSRRRSRRSLDRSRSLAASSRLSLPRRLSGAGGFLSRERWRFGLVVGVRDLSRRSTSSGVAGLLLSWEDPDPPAAAAPELTATPATGSGLGATGLDFFTVFFFGVGAGGGLATAVCHRPRLLTCGRRHGK
jgi:hypothetical protein